MFRQREDEEEEEEAAEGRSHLQTSNYNMTVQSTVLIKDSIRQGGVLSTAQCAILMDGIAKEIKNKKGVKLPDTEEEIGSLL